MPKGTAVHRCVTKVKAKGGGVNPYAVCQKATGMSYATGKKLKSHMPAGASMSPKGDIGAQRAAEAAKVVHMKGWGDTLTGTGYLPFRREKMASDPSHSGHREAPRDEVV